MKKRIFIRITALVLTVALTVGFIPSCGPSNDDSGENAIPYHEKYVFNSMNPTESNRYTARPYLDLSSYPIIMGGNYYHGGFILDYTEGPYEGGFATFDVSHLEGKKLSFVLGSTEFQLNDYDRYSIVNVYADNKQVVDTAVFARKAPERFIIDLTGVSTLRFQIYEGRCYVGVAEITAWDTEPVATGPAIADNVNKLQLVKDILPFSMSNAVTLRSKREVTSEQITNTYGNSEETIALRKISNDDVTVGGKSYNEAVITSMTAVLMGDDKEFFCFNTEGMFEYLSFMLGCENVKNQKEGTSWISVYADDKLVAEENVVSTELPRRVTVKINKCSTLRFEVENSTSQHTPVIFDAFVGKSEADVTAGGSSSGVSGLGDACRLINSIAPYAVASNIEDPLYDGVTKHRTFSMAGRKYYEGIALRANASWVAGNSGAHICFNLDGQFKYLTFVAGLLDKTETVVNDKLNIYLDGVLSRTIDLYALDLPREYTVELKNCRELKIELVGFDAMIRPTYGVANMVVYRDEVVENTIFEEPAYNYPDKMTLLENITPYLYNYGYGDMGDEDYYYVYTGSKQHGFYIGEELKHEGFLLQTSVHMDITGDAGQSAMMMVAMTGIGALALGGMMLLAADTVYESSFAAFDMGGQFKKVTFTVACQDRQEFMDQPQTETLKIGSSEKIFAEFEIGSRMEPKTYTVDIENTDQLMFWLQCGDGTSSRYAIYDVVVEK